MDEEVNYAVGKNLYSSNQVGRKKEKKKKERNKRKKEKWDKVHPRWLMIK